MDRATFITRLEHVKNAVQILEGKICCWEIGEPAPIKTVHEIEEKYQLKLPADFVEAVTQIAGKVEIAWSIWEVGLRKSYPKFSDISSGTLQWDIQHYLEEKTYLGYLCYTTNWQDLHGLLDFADVPNGDMIFLNLAHPGKNKPVVYLNHDGEYTHPVQLAESFEDYVERLLKIGLVGSEIWQLEKFIQPMPEEKNGKPSVPGVIDPECAYALEWRKLMGLL